MKNNLITLIAIFLLPVNLYAQSTLPESSKGSAHLYIYSVDKNDLRRIHLKDRKATEDMLGKYITDFPLGEPMPLLPRGNYLLVNAVEEKLNISDYVVDDLYFKIVPSGKFMLCLYDSLGNIITDAIVKCGSQTLTYNHASQTYNTDKVKPDEILEINHRGVYHYIEVEVRGNHSYYVRKYNPIKRAWWSILGIWQGVKNEVAYLLDLDERPTKDKYTGFVVFSKPRYKPGETVKLKAYMAQHDGTPYNKPVGIRLYKHYPVKVDTILAHIEPYRPGMYEFEFELSDKLNLSLDVSYTIELETGKERYNKIFDNFRYEDYELKGIRFSMETDKDKYHKGDSVKLKFNITDENGMMVYDGKLELLVRANSLNFQDIIKKTASGFIPDTLWNHTLALDGTLKREILLPDSIFPPGISFNYTVDATYLSADNEKQTAEKQLFRNADDTIIDFSLNKGMLTISQLSKGESQPVMADICVEGENGEVLLSKSHMLPHTMSVPWFATDVIAQTIHTTGNFSIREEKEDQLECQFYRQNDSIYLKVDNPAGIPFWYTVCRNKNEIAHGYTTRLDYAVKDNTQGYTMRISYLFGEGGKVIEKSLPFIQKNISMEVSTPTTVYPGQKTGVHIKVTDKKGKPVNHADITAYAYTSKFQQQRMPGIAIYGKMKHIWNLKTKDYSADANVIYNQKTSMTWDRWKDMMSLDTIAYYNFLYPENYYVYTEPSTDKSTLISPYVVIDGVLQMVHLLWIDDRLYYTTASGQWDVYSFPVEAGNHTLKFRTVDRDVAVHNIYVEEGKKNIFSFNAASPYSLLESMDKKQDVPLIITSRMRKKKERFPFTKSEKEYLSGQLITIDNNFGTIHFPNIRKTMDIPAYMNSGDTYHYINHASTTRYDNTLKGVVNVPVVIGPFPKLNTRYGIANFAAVSRDSSDLLAWIELEGGNKYTVYPGYQKIKNWDKTPFINDSRIRAYARDFREVPLTVDKIMEHSRNHFFSIPKNNSGLAQTRDVGKSTGRLNLYLGKDRDGKPLKPVLIYIVPDEKKDIGKYQLYYGGTRNFDRLPFGKVNVSLIFSDSTSYTQPLALHPGGRNFIHIDSILYDLGKERARTILAVFNREVKKAYSGNPFKQRNTMDTVVTKTAQDSGRFRNPRRGMISGIVRDDSGEPLIGVSIQIAGTNIGTISDIDGYFELSGGSPGDKIDITYLGYVTQSVEYKEGVDYDIRLSEDGNMLDEVVVVAYGVAKVYGLNQNNRALTGTIFSEMRTSITGSVSEVKSGGAIGGVPEPLTPLLDNDLAFAIRRNFHDDAFWQPRLTTNEKGEASFEVTYPDDVTSWDAFFVAIGNKKQTDKQQMTIRSLKTLVASLSIPRFAIRGDSLNVVGKITNHTGDSVDVKRKIAADGRVQDENLRLSTSHIDYIPVKIQNGDSVTLSYSLLTEGGYLDGEERSLPVMERGMEQTYGNFKVLNDTATQVFTPDPGLGMVTVHAEATSLEMFLKEIEKVDKYPFMCNEQMASKIKVLLAKKRIAGIFGKKFDDDQKIKNLISRLSKNANMEGYWGWWNKDRTVFWITNQVISALLDANEAGYKTNLDIPVWGHALSVELATALANLRLTTPDKVPYAKQELLQRLITLKRINIPFGYEQYIDQINELLPDRTLTDKLKVMECMAAVGLKDKINTDSLMHYSRRTVLGSLFWGEEKKKLPLHRVFDLPYNNDTDNTLIAYKILKTIGGHEKEMEQIQHYFFERRQGGAWANTYESSQIIATIMPDILNPGQQYAEVSLTLNGRKITEFPFTGEITSSVPVYIKKEGTAPVFLTVYQQAWNADPQKESSKGLAVSSVFTVKGDTVPFLTAGKTTQLEVTVTLEADAEYVQIEIPVPAGCSYDSQIGGRNRNEVHREHFKDKVVIFSNKLTKGEHTFSIDLIPRYTGRYSLNPAKVELMYFPVFYGNEKLKSCPIQE